MLRITHLVFGLVLFGVFLVTGHYMRADFPDKEAINQELRLLMRSRHIYILFSSLLHVLAGLYLFRPGSAWRQWVQGVGSVVLFASSILLLSAFIFETYYSQHFGEMSRNGIYATGLALALHLIANIRLPSGKERG